MNTKNKKVYKPFNFFDVNPLNLVAELENTLTLST